MVYAVLPILSPIAFKIGLEPIGQGIQYIYRIFCHQRVDRSAFLFGEDGIVSFYTIEELQEKNVIPVLNPYAPLEEWADEFYAYPYFGNEEVGYKMAFCIRDLALYGALAVSSVAIYLYIIKTGKLVKFPWQVLIALMLPMVLDGMFQLVVEYFGINGIDPALLDAYVTNILKRVVTGALFGIGFGFLIIPALIDSTVDAPELTSKAKS